MNTMMNLTAKLIGSTLPILICDVGDIDINQAKLNLSDLFWLREIQNYRHKFWKTIRRGFGHFFGMMASR